MLTSKTNLFLQGIADRDLNVILQKGMRKLAMANRCFPRYVKHDPCWPSKELLRKPLLFIAYTPRHGVYHYGSEFDKKSSGVSVFLP